MIQNINLYVLGQRESVLYLRAQIGVYICVYWACNFVTETSTWNWRSRWGNGVNVGAREVFCKWGLWGEEGQVSCRPHLTPWSRVLLGGLTVQHVVKNLRTLYNPNVHYRISNSPPFIQWSCESTPHPPSAFSDLLWHYLSIYAWFFKVASLLPDFQQISVCHCEILPTVLLSGLTYKYL